MEPEETYGFSSPLFPPPSPPTRPSTFGEFPLKGGSRRPIHGRTHRLAVLVRLEIEGRGRKREGRRERGWREGERREGKEKQKRGVGQGGKRKDGEDENEMRKE